MKSKISLPKTEAETLRQMEKQLEAVEEKLARIDKQIDMTQKIVHVEVACNAVRLKQEFTEEIKKHHYLQMDKLDKIVKELEETREDRELATYQTRELRDEIEAHEKRITQLEKSLQSA